MFLSQFRFYSVGRALTNKKRGSMTIEVCPLEVVNLSDGEMVPNFTDLASKGLDGEDQNYDVSVTASNSLEATWLQFGSNRTTPPDIRRGERVILLQYGDTEIFYWVALGMDDELRRLETAIFAFSNTRDETVRTLTPDNSYYFEVSTHDKHVTLHTSKSDGEPYAYDIQVNTKAGIVTVQDDDGQVFELNSKERRWTMVNRDESMVMLDKKNAYVHTPSLINLKTTDIHMECKNFLLECQTGVIDAKKSFLIKTPTMTIDNGGTGAGTTTINGDTQITGTAQVMMLTSLMGGLSAFPAGSTSTPIMSITTGDGQGTAPAMTFDLDFSLEAGKTFNIDAAAFIKQNDVSIGTDHQHTSSSPGVASSPVIGA